MKRFAVAIALALFIGLWAAPVDAAGPMASVKPSRVNFGQVTVGAYGWETVHVTNRTNEALTVHVLANSVFWTEYGNDYDWTIDPGTRWDFLVSFEPGSPGKYLGSLVVSTTGFSKTLTLVGSGV